MKMLNANFSIEFLISLNMTISDLSCHVKFPNFGMFKSDVSFVTSNIDTRDDAHHVVVRIDDDYVPETETTEELEDARQIRVLVE